MERPLFVPSPKHVISDFVLTMDDEELDASALFAQTIVDKAELARNIRIALQDRSQITLKELIDKVPLKQGLAELVTYLHIGCESFHTVVDEDNNEIIIWLGEDADGQTINRRARLPRLIFSR